MTCERGERSDSDAAARARRLPGSLRPGPRGLRSSSRAGAPLRVGLQRQPAVTLHGRRSRPAQLRQPPPPPPLPPPRAPTRAGPHRGPGEAEPRSREEGGRQAPSARPPGPRARPYSSGEVTSGSKGTAAPAEGRASRPAFPHARTLPAPPDAPVLRMRRRRSGPACSLAARPGLQRRLGALGAAAQAGTGQPPSSEAERFLRGPGTALSGSRMDMLAWFAKGE